MFYSIYILHIYNIHMYYIDNIYIYIFINIAIKKRIFKKLSLYYYIK